MATYVPKPTRIKYQSCNPEIPSEEDRRVMNNEEFYTSAASKTARMSRYLNIR